MEQEQEAHGIAGGLDAENRNALVDMAKPQMDKRVCGCGVVIHGAKGFTPNKCSATCRGEKI